MANLECKVTEGVVLLTGSVPSYYLKQVAQETVMKLKVAFGLENGITVQRN